MADWCHGIACVAVLMSVLISTTYCGGRGSSDEGVKNGGQKEKCIRFKTDDDDHIHQSECDDERYALCETSRPCPCQSSNVSHCKFNVTGRATPLPCITINSTCYWRGIRGDMDDAECHCRENNGTLANFTTQDTLNTFFNSGRCWYTKLVNKKNKKIEDLWLGYYTQAPGDCGCRPFPNNIMNVSLLPGLIQSIQNNLTLPINNLSSTVRKLTSASDNRLSSMYICATAIILMFSFLAAIVVSDMSTIYGSMRRHWRCNERKVDAMM